MLNISHPSDALLILLNFETPLGSSKQQAKWMLLDLRDVSGQSVVDVSVSAPPPAQYGTEGWPPQSNTIWSPDAS